jgi:hypothetical protein
MTGPEHAPHNGLEFCWRGLSGRKADGTTAYPPQQSYGRGSEPRRALFTSHTRSETPPSRLPAQQQFLVRRCPACDSRKQPQSSCVDARRSLRLRSN